MKNTLSRINTGLDTLGEINSELKIRKQMLSKMRQPKQTDKKPWETMNRLSGPFWKY